MIAEDKKSEDMSVEDILKSIKGIITSHNKIDFKNYDIRDQEILELTDIIKEEKRPRNASTEDEYSEKFTEDAGLNNRQEQLISKKSAFEAGRTLKNFAQQATIASESKKIKNLSLEELVVEMMRPQLSKWLNDNLPRLVKELVEKEIKRLALNE